MDILTVANKIGNFINKSSDLLAQVNESKTIHIDQPYNPFKKIEMSAVKHGEPFRPLRAIENKDQKHIVDPKVIIEVVVKNCNHPVNINNTITIK